MTSAALSGLEPYIHQFPCMTKNNSWLFVLILMLFQLGMNKLENKLCGYKFRVSKVLTIEHFILHCSLSF